MMMQPIDTVSNLRQRKDKGYSIDSLPFYVLCR